MVVVDLFLRYLITEKRYSNHTVRSYKNDLMQFEEFIRLHYNSDDLLSSNSRHIRSWVISLLDAGLSPRSVNRKTTALRRFYRFCQQDGLIRNNPADSVPSLKTSKPLPVFVEEVQIKQVLGGQELTGEFASIRDLLILEILYGTGIRVSELAGLKDGEVDIQKGQIKVIGKRMKERIVPVNEGLSGLIKDYREARKKEFPEFSGIFLLVTDQGKPVYPRMIYRVVNSLLSAGDINGRKSPHVLRHTYATHLLNHGAELNAIKELLGHASLSATQVYTHTSFEKLKKVYEKAHPRA
jgi:integrase/recombinase XerC